MWHNTVSKTTNTDKVGNKQYNLQLYLHDDKQGSHTEMQTGVVEVHLSFWPEIMTVGDISNKSGCWELGKSDFRVIMERIIRPT